MRAWLGVMAAVVALGWAATASAADYKTLHAINGGPPTVVPPLPADSKPRAVQFVRVVLHPQDGEAWALEYRSFAVDDPDHPGPPPRLVSWNSGAAEQKIAPFERVFEEEMRKAGFAAQTSDSTTPAANNQSMRASSPNAAPSIGTAMSAAHASSPGSVIAVSNRASSAVVRGVWRPSAYVAPAMTPSSHSGSRLDTTGMCAKLK